MTSTAEPPFWLVSNDVASFDAASALRNRDDILWSQTRHDIRVGDLVCLYATLPVGAITHVLSVTERDVAAADADPTFAYWRDPTAAAERADRSWMRLHLLHELTPDEQTQLSLAELRAAKGHGSDRDNFQGRRRLTGGMLDLVRRVLVPPPTVPGDDAYAEHAEVDNAQCAAFTAQIADGQYAVDDAYATAKTRGSAQHAFATAVKASYGHRCAVTGITTPAFLVASHIVPWSADHTIRLDPRNGICLSTLIDRSYDTGFLRITPDATVEVDQPSIRNDPALAAALNPYHGRPLALPDGCAPAREYLERRYHTGLLRAGQTPLVGSRGGWT